MTICIGPRTQRPAGSGDEHRGGFRSGHVKARPADVLAPYVAFYWVSRWERRDGSSTRAAALLDPCVHLQISAGRAELMGVMRGAYRVTIAGTGYIVGARFRPGGFFPFVGQPVERWTDRVVAAGEVLAAADDAWAARLGQAIDGCTGDADAHAAIAAAHLDALLLPLLTDGDAIACEMANLVERTARDASIRRLDDLARASGRSERTLHRLFNRYVGVSPAWVIRRYRLHEAARRLAASPDLDVQGLAYELGYADQAHFIRDFRATVGVTPGAFISARR